MDSFLNPNNGTSLTGVIDVTAHNIYLFQRDGTVKHILDILFPCGDIAIAELVDVQIHELGNNVIQLYQFVGDINDKRVPGLESILYYISENFFRKADPAVNEHSYYIKKHLIPNTMKNIIAINNNISQIMSHIII